MLPFFIPYPPYVSLSNVPVRETFPLTGHLLVAYFLYLVLRLHDPQFLVT